MAVLGVFGEPDGMQTVAADAASEVGMKLSRRGVSKRRERKALGAWQSSMGNQEAGGAMQCTVPRSWAAQWQKRGRQAGEQTTWQAALR